MKASLCLKYLDYTKGTGLDKRGSRYKVSNSRFQIPSYVPIKCGAIWPMLLATMTDHCNFSLVLISHLEKISNPSITLIPLEGSSETLIIF